MLLVVPMEEQLGAETIQPHKMNITTSQGVLFHQVQVELSPLQAEPEKVMLQELVHLIMEH
ncbi:MAG: hypothetical protein ACJA08_002110 [Cyclobacteriaceae bacterium]|jgi:hypothetical protein